MSHKLITHYENAKIKGSKFNEVLNKIWAGSIVQVKLKPVNGAKAQSYVGICIAHKHRGLATSLLLRNFIAGEAIEYMIYPYSGIIEDINIINYAKLNYRYRRSKLYYLRKRTPKESTVILK